MILGLAAFVALIVILSALRARILFELQATSLLLFASKQPGLWFYTILMLPGTILHELSHWLMAEILQVRTREISILPEDGDGEQRLGSVQTSRSGPLRGFLIGIAPFVTGLAVLSLLGYFLRIGWGVYHPAWLALIIYGLVVVGSSMLISRADRRYWPFMLLLLAVLAAIILVTGYTPPPQVVVQLTPVLTSINLVLVLTIVLSLGMILLLYCLRWSAQKLTRKKVIL